MRVLRVTVVADDRGVRWRAARGSPPSAEPLAAALRRLRPREVCFPEPDLLLEPEVRALLCELPTLVGAAVVAGRRWDLGTPLGAATWRVLALACEDLAERLDRHEQSTSHPSVPGGGWPA